MAGSVEQRRTYIYCQETKLVRIVLEHVNKEEYGECIKRTLDTVKVRKMVMSAVNGEGASVGGSAGARPEPEQQEHKQRDTTGSREEGKQRKQAEEKSRQNLGVVADSDSEWLMRE